jgi:hypothetical protein
MAMILDIVEVPKSHTGANLALAFTKVLNNFRVSEKVRLILVREEKTHTVE